MPAPVTTISIYKPDKPDKYVSGDFEIDERAFGYESDLAPYKLEEIAERMRTAFAKFSEEHDDVSRGRHLRDLAEAGWSYFKALFSTFRARDSHSAEQAELARSKFFSALLGQPGVIIFDAEIHAPWNLLYLQEPGQEPDPARFLGARHAVFQRIGMPGTLPPVGLPFSIIAASGPGATMRAELDQLLALATRCNIPFTKLPKVNSKQAIRVAEAFAGLWKRNNPNILHFACHYDAREGTFELDCDAPSTAKMRADHLAVLLMGLREMPAFGFFNCCDFGLGGPDLDGGSAGSVSPLVGSSIFTDVKIETSLAAWFSSSFYDSLFGGKTAPQAYVSARGQLKTLSRDEMIKGLGYKMTLVDGKQLDPLILGP